MPITKDTNNVITYTQKRDRWSSDVTGVFGEEDFAIASRGDPTKQLKADVESLPASTVVTLKANSATAADIIVTLPATSGTLELTGSGSTPSFSTIQVPAGTSPVATSPTDVLTLAAGHGVAITGDATTDTVTFSVSGLVTTDIAGFVAGASAAAPVQSVAGRTGTVTLTKSDVGLSNVDNTADASKPVSTAQAAADALNLKIASNLSDINNATTARANLGCKAPDVQIFTSSSTWTYPAGGVITEVIAFGAGGGGGSGMKVNSGSACSGGAGGGGGGRSQKRYRSAQLSTSETVTIGAFGAGGAIQTTNNTAGIIGFDGGTTTFGKWVRAVNGTGGQGGQPAGASTGGSAGTGMSPGLAGAGGVNGAQGANAATTGTAAGGQGGAGGGGIVAAGPAATSGGAVGSNFNSNFNTITAQGIATVGAPGASGVDEGGQGGSGGGASVVGAAAKGGKGGANGAGGGGGGSSLSSVGDSGAGGDGADGYCIVITYF